MLSGNDWRVRSLTRSRRASLTNVNSASNIFRKISRETLLSQGIATHTKYLKRDTLVSHQNASGKLNDQDYISRNMIT